MDNEDLVWTTKDGRNIALKDMTDSHLENAYNYTKRRILKGETEVIRGKMVLDCLQTEQKRRKTVKEHESREFNVFKAFS